jgi:hypothetical protein
MHRFSDKLAEESGSLGEICVGVLDGEARDEKFEVVVRHPGSARASVELRLVRWGEGLGWYAQRTMTLPPDLAGLRALLRRAQRLRSGDSAVKQRRAVGRLLALPNPRM